MPRTDHRHEPARSCSWWIDLLSPMTGLTRELISRAHPHSVADDPAAMRLLSDEDIAASLDETLAAENVTNELWVFAYGSLMWKPDLEVAERRIATVRGWHRRFCLWQWRFRGTRDCPGVMLALDRGGSCVGIVYKVIGPDVECAPFGGQRHAAVLTRRWAC